MAKYESSQNDSFICNSKLEHLRCSICGRRRSLRRLDRGPDNLFDRLVCSRSKCGRLKAFLNRIMHLFPIIQINYYSVEDSCKSDYASAERLSGHYQTPSTEKKISPAQVPANPVAVFELHHQSSPTGRFELHGESRSNANEQTIPLSYDKDDPPPPVRYSRKPHGRT